MQHTDSAIVNLNKEKVVKKVAVTRIIVQAMLRSSIEYRDRKICLRFKVQFRLVPCALGNGLLHIKPIKHHRFKLCLIWPGQIQGKKTKACQVSNKFWVQAVVDLDFIGLDFFIIINFFLFDKFRDDRQVEKYISI